MRDRVIVLGDALFGSTVTGLGGLQAALNDAGDVAFLYSLADGRTGIARAGAVAGTSSMASPLICAPRGHRADSAQRNHSGHARAASTGQLVTERPRGATLERERSLFHPRAGRNGWIVEHVSDRFVDIHRDRTGTRRNSSLGRVPALSGRTVADKRVRVPSDEDRAVERVDLDGESLTGCRSVVQLPDKAKSALVVPRRR